MYKRAGCYTCKLESTYSKYCNLIGYSMALISVEPQWCFFGQRKPSLAQAVSKRKWVWLWRVALVVDVDPETEPEPMYEA